MKRPILIKLTLAFALIFLLPQSGIGSDAEAPVNASKMLSALAGVDYEAGALPGCVLKKGDDCGTQLSSKLQQLAAEVSGLESDLRVSQSPFRGQQVFGAYKNLLAHLAVDVRNIAAGVQNAYYANQASQTKAPESGSDVEAVVLKLVKEAELLAASLGLHDATLQVADVKAKLVPIESVEAINKIIHSSPSDPAKDCDLRQKDLSTARQIVQMIAEGKDLPTKSPPSFFYSRKSYESLVFGYRTGEDSQDLAASARNNSLSWSGSIRGQIGNFEVAAAGLRNTSIADKLHIPDLVGFDLNLLAELMQTGVRDLDQAFEIEADRIDGPYKRFRQAQISTAADCTVTPQMVWNEIEAVKKAGGGDYWGRLLTQEESDASHPPKNAAVQQNPACPGCGGAPTGMSESMNGAGSFGVQGSSGLMGPGGLVGGVSGGSGGSGGSPNP